MLGAGSESDATSELTPKFIAVRSYEYRVQRVNPISDTVQDVVLQI